MPLHLVSVDEHSPAQRLGLKPGCTLLAIDGNPLNDALDYQFYTSAPHFTLTIDPMESCRCSIHSHL